jgi:RimJ/RimL family protein N-acetyltransferase
MISLRQVAPTDYELIMAWRSHPDLYAGFALPTGPLVWADHKAWWDTRTCREDWLVRLTNDGHTRSVGVVSASRLDTECPEVGIYIGEISLWGKGIGAAAVNACMGQLRDAGYARCHARILPTNSRSRHLFMDLGFTLVDGSLDSGTELYECRLAEGRSPR